MGWGWLCECVASRRRSESVPAHTCTRIKRRQRSDNNKQQNIRKWKGKKHRKKFIRELQQQGSNFRLSMFPLDLCTTFNSIKIFLPAARIYKAARHYVTVHREGFARKFPRTFQKQIEELLHQPSFSCPWKVSCRNRKPHFDERAREKRFSKRAFGVGETEKSSGLRKGKSAHCEEHPQNSVYLFRLFSEPTQRRRRAVHYLEIENERTLVGWEVQNFPFIFNAKFSLSYTDDDADDAAHQLEREPAYQHQQIGPCDNAMRMQHTRQREKIERKIAIQIRGKENDFHYDDLASRSKSGSSWGMRRGQAPPPGKLFRQWKCA